MWRTALAGLFLASEGWCLNPLPESSSQYVYVPKLFESSIKRASSESSIGIDPVKRQISDGVRNSTTTNEAKTATIPVTAYTGIPIPVYRSKEGYIALLSSSIGGFNTTLDFIVDTGSSSSFVRMPKDELDPTETFIDKTYTRDQLNYIPQASKISIPWGANLADWARLEGYMTIRTDLGTTAGDKFQASMGILARETNFSSNAMGILGLGYQEQGQGSRVYPENASKWNSTAHTSLFRKQTLWEQDGGKISFFTTYFSIKDKGAADGKFRRTLGLNYEDPSWYEGPLNPVPVATDWQEGGPKRKNATFSSDLPVESTAQEWQVMRNNQDEDWSFSTGHTVNSKPGSTSIFPLRIILDTKSEYTWINQEVANEIYKNFGGDCDLNSTSFLKLGAPDDYWSQSNQKLPAAFCTFPCSQNFSDTIFGMLPRPTFNTPDIIVELLWKESRIRLLSSTLSAHRRGDLPNRGDTSENANCIGSIQPLPDTDSPWIYGRMVYLNAFFKFDIANKSISMAQYNQTPWGSNNIVGSFDLNKVQW